MLRPFHLAFPVHDLSAARAFYGGTLGCREGRSSDAWIDFDLFGHQIVAHLDPAARRVSVENAVDGHDVPSFRCSDGCHASSTDVLVAVGEDRFSYRSWSWPLPSTQAVSTRTERAGADVC